MILKKYEHSGIKFYKSSVRERGIEFNPSYGKFRHFNRTKTCYLLHGMYGISIEFQTIKAVKKYIDNNFRH